MKEDAKIARSKADFIRLSGIGPEMAGFVTEFIAKPDNYFSLTSEERREIEKRMEAILSSFLR